MLQANRALVSRLLVTAALLVFYALAVSTALDKSPTNDEPVHMTRGALLHQSRDFAIQEGHMPLSHWLIGTLFSTEPALPQIRGLDAWESGDRLDMAAEFLWHRGVDVDRLSFLARIPIIWTGLLLGAVLALWTTAVARSTIAAADGGEWSVVAALGVVMILYAFSSNIIASASVATTDFVTTAAYFGAVCAWWFFWQRPGWTLWLVTGILLGMVLGSKLTGVLLVPLLLPLAYVYPGKTRSWWRPGLLWLALLPISALSLWAIYAFSIGEWAGLTLPAPAYWESWQSVLGHVGAGHQAFFMGQLSKDGWWLYFPVSFLIKTPVVWLVLIGAALVLLVRRKISWQVAAFTLLPSGALFAAAVVSRLNIGYRHILPVGPFLLVLMGHALPALWPNRVARWAVGIGVALTAAIALWIHPNHLAAFNLAVGGPAQGYHYLGDSNLDWGQDLRALAEYVAAYDATGAGSVAYSYAGSADPAYYGLTAPSLSGPDATGSPDFSPANPAPGRYAISANHIQGVLADSDLFDWFRSQTPVDSLGYSILIYDVPAAQPGDWITQCTNPGPAITPEGTEELLGVDDARHMLVDCSQTTVWPNDGAPGWTIVSGYADDDIMVYRHRASAQAPAYSVQYAAEPILPDSLLTSAVTVTGEQVTLPQQVGGVAELVGYQVTGSQWQTVWRVLAATDRPLSVQAHLLDADGALLAVADSLGFSSDQWRPGDVFSQRFDFGDAPAGGAFLETGLYDYTTLEPQGPLLRLPVVSESGD